MKQYANVVFEEPFSPSQSRETLHNQVCYNVFSYFKLSFS